MIYGIGTDLLAIERGMQLWARFGARAATRLLMPAEAAAFEQAADRGRFLARAFAVKEAYVKALGTGFRGVSYRDVGVLRDPGQRPRLVFSAAMRQRLDVLRIGAAHVSLSDDQGFVFAFVVLETAASTSL